MSVSLAHYEEALEVAQVAVKRWGAGGRVNEEELSYRLDHAIEAERAQAHALRRPQGVLRRSG